MDPCSFNYSGPFENDVYEFFINKECVLEKDDDINFDDLNTNISADDFNESIEEFIPRTTPQQDFSSTSVENLSGVSSTMETEDAENTTHSFSPDSQERSFPIPFTDFSHSYDMCFDCSVEGNSQEFLQEDQKSCHSDEESDFVVDDVDEEKFIRKRRKIKADDENLMNFSFENSANYSYNTTPIPFLSPESAFNEPLPGVSSKYNRKKRSRGTFNCSSQATRNSPSKRKRTPPVKDSEYDKARQRIENVMQNASPAIEQLKEMYKEVCNIFAVGGNAPKPEGLQQELMPYQWFGYKWMEILYQNGIGGCLADGMGLGKTIQAIALIQAIIHQKQQRNEKPRILISCPANLISNWIRELKVNCPGLQDQIDISNGGEELNSMIDLISHQKLRLNSNKELEQDADEVYPFDQQWDLVVMDEFHTFLSSNPSKEAMRLLRRNTSGFMALTGTPMPNNLMELYQLNTMLNPDIYSDINVFNNLCIKPAQQTLKNLLFQSVNKEEKVVEPAKLEQMENYVVQLIEILVKPFLLRRQNSYEEFKFQTAIMQARGSAIQSLPPLQSDSKISYPFTELQDQLTQSIINNSKESLEKIHEKGALSLFETTRQKNKNENSVGLRESIYLQQIADHPSILLNSESAMKYMDEIKSKLKIEKQVDYEEPGKLQTIISLIRRILEVNPQDKILIFTNYEQMGHLICKGLQAAQLTPTINKVRFLYGEIKKKERSPMIDDFQSPEGPPVLVVGRKLGSVGWNCVSANHLVITDPWWSPNDDDQCIGRLHRIGQKKSVFVYRLHRDSFIVDNKMESLRIEKKAWCELILSGDTSDVKQRIQEILGKSPQTTHTQTNQSEE